MDPPEEALQREIEYKQAIIMGQELRQVYKEAKALKESLQREKMVLELKQREVQNLNKFLHRQLDECMRVHEAYYSLLQKLRLLLVEPSSEGALHIMLSGLLEDQQEAYTGIGQA